MGNYSIRPIINVPSDHDAQSITLHSFNLRPPTKKCMLIRQINEHTFQRLLNIKRELFIACTNSNNLALINHYKRYCKILSAVIRKPKNLIMQIKLKNP